MSSVQLIPTEALKDRWVTQDRVYPDDWWLTKYWGDTEGSHRDAIIRALEQLDGVASVLEVGCNTGPNLRRIHARWPLVDLAGMDIHPGAIQFGRAQAQEEGWHFAGYVGDLRELGLLGEDAADVVLSCYALAYLDPRDIQAVLEACVRAARRAVVLCEPMVLDGDEQFSPGGVPEYAYDYGKRLAGLGTLKVSQVEPPHGRLTHVLSLTK